MTQAQQKFSLLRSILKALGLSPAAIDDIVERIVDLLSEREDQTHVEFPYAVRDDFLSPAEQSFFFVLKAAAADWALVCPKVALGDLFFAKASDPSQFRTYTNKIDRKHVDFLLCDPKTTRPLLGIELNDQSHQRTDRQARDEFVRNVFQAAHLPLVPIPVRPSYSSVELNTLLKQSLPSAGIPTASPETFSAPPTSAAAPPVCPKCGSTMVLRTAKSGAKIGGQFWGCSNFPRCRGIVKYEPSAAPVSP